jgi:peptidoglycan hydrolase-like protein with peptidoglycan-binding domain
MRRAKQIVFGLAFLIIIGLLGLGVYNAFLKPAPSCFNSIQDQGETGVDCGGPCVPCELKSLKDIQIHWVKIFRATDTASGVVAEIYNPNPDWAVKSFDYQFNLKDQFGRVVKNISGTSFAYGGELKYLIEPRIEIPASQITSPELTITGLQWISAADYPKPDVEVQGTKTDKIDTLFVSGKIVNRSEIDFTAAVAYALVYNQNGNLVAASKTIVDNVPKFGSKDFKISFAKDLDLYQPSEAPPTFTRTLQVGDSGKDVGMLQLFLAEGNFLDRQPTNYFDDITKQALSKMQAEIGIPASGIFDDLTLQIFNYYLTSTSTIGEITKLQIEKSVDPAKTKVLVEAKR